MEKVPAVVTVGFPTDFGLKMIATGAEVVEVIRIGSEGVCLGLGLFVRLRSLGDAAGRRCLDGWRVQRSTGKFTYA